MVMVMIPHQAEIWDYIMIAHIPFHLQAKKQKKKESVSKKSNIIITNDDGDDGDDSASSLIIELYNNIAPHVASYVGKTKRQSVENSSTSVNSNGNSNSNDFQLGTPDVELDSLTSEKKPEIYNLGGGITIKKFYDYRPNDNVKYFNTPKNKDGEKKGHAAVIPFFNEESHELQQTLNSLHITHSTLRQQSKKWSDKPLRVCLIQDGWHKAAESMKIYLAHLFKGKINNIGWWNYFEELISESSANSNATFIIERENYASTNINPQEHYKDDPTYMDITLVIKANNRRKHNSHEWFLARSGFAEASMAKYLFLTDAFTFYEKDCLYHLTKELDRNPKLSGVTGRQRVMTRDEQGSDTSVFSFGNILTHMQSFDFELANAVYNGACALGGFLFVVPGPCGMYKASDLLQNNVRDSYFNVVNEEPDKTGLALGNLKIAEDRILTYYSVMKTSEERHLAFNQQAVFYFEAETDLQKFLFQRRRWINGSVAGYIYFLFGKGYGDFKKWDAPWYRKLYVWMLLMSHFIIYCMVGVAAAVVLKTLYYGIEYFMGVFDIESKLGLILTFIIIWAIYVIHLFVHHHKKFNYIIMYILVLLSFLTSIVTYASLFYYTFVDERKKVEDIFTSSHPVFYMAFIVLFAPFLSALFLSGRGHSFLYMIKSFVPYVVFLPLLIAFFGSYAYSRIYDLTWGSRPANDLNDITHDQRKIMMVKFKEQSVRVILFMILVNIAVFFIPLQGQLYLMAIFFVIAIIQLFFSTVYTITKIEYKCETIRNYFKEDKNKKKHVCHNIVSSENSSSQAAELMEVVVQSGAQDSSPSINSSPNEFVVTI